MNLLWDVFCRVVDNWGDVGVCWRLAADLGERGERVRLWIDDASALAWMAPEGAANVDVKPWPVPDDDIAPGDVVIEAFGCDPPSAFVARMAMARPAPVWINLEYLSAEDFARRAHRLPSPQLSGPGDGLTKWFFYPGFREDTGGLIREPGLLDERRAFDRNAWLRSRGIEAMAGERIVSVFCYPGAPLGSLMALLGPLSTLPTLPTLALIAADPGLSIPPQPGLRVHTLPRLTQRAYDRLLWSSDLNVVRGEDSFGRAQWAAAPFVWQIYPQADGAHEAKLNAFLDAFLEAAPSSLADHVRAVHHAWNGLLPADRLQASGPDLLPAWAAWCVHWRDQLVRQQELTTRLMDLAAQKR